MIATKSTTPVATSGIQSEAFFNVKQENLAFVFGILRNNLYSDKFLAILREYSANAVDAHVAAGTPNRPFAVSMPNALSSALVIRDFGMGLSEADVYNVFASYGASTKRETNDQIGGFGLGSKSAFCYVDSFTIVSYFDGKKSLYEAFIDDTNIGKVVKMTEEPSDEESGIEITVTVKPQDISSFVSTAKNLYKHFTPKPIIKNNAELSRFLDDHVAATPVMNGENWTLSKQNNGTTVACVMGNIRYPIDTYKLNGMAGAWVRSLNNLELILKTPIGSVKMSASRESLEYDEDTINFLNDFIESARKEAAENVNNQLAACKTMWEARLLLRSVSGNVGNLQVNPIWNGVRIDNPNFISESVLKLIVNPERLLTLPPSKRFGAKRKWVQAQSITVKRSTVIYVEKGDVSRNTVYARISQDMKDNGYNDDLYVARFATAQEALNFTSHHQIVGAKIIDVSTIDYVAPARAKRGASDGVKTKQMYSAFVYNNNEYASVKSMAWNPQEVDVNGGAGVYMRIHGYAPTAQENDLGLCTLSDLTSVLDNIQQLRGVRPEVYGFRTKVENLGAGWVTLIQKVQETVKEECAKADFQEIVLSNWAVAKVDNFLRLSPEHVNELNPDGVLGKMANRLAKIRTLNAQDKNRYDAAVALATKCGLRSEIENLCGVERAEIEQMQQDVIEAYPMLKTVMRSYHAWESYKDEILDYVGLVDKQ